MLPPQTGSAFAQGNFPFPEPGAEWHITRLLPILDPNNGNARWKYNATGDSAAHRVPSWRMASWR